MGESKEKTFFIHYLPIYGSFSTGLIYGAIGIVAMLSFFRIKDGGADESSLMAYLNDFLLGKILIGIIFFGALSYIIWRIYESYKDPYNYGSNWKGLMRRTGIALSSIADILIAYSAFVILFGSSQAREDGVPTEEREMVGSMLSENWGDWAVISIGIIILFTALVQFFYGISRGYKERLTIGHFSANSRTAIHILAWVGYLARGIIIGVIGFFFMKAGILEDPTYIVNTDKAFNFIGEKIGHLFFILVAIGTISYAAFMFFLGYTYKIEDRDHPLITS